MCPVIKHFFPVYAIRKKKIIHLIFCIAIGHLGSTARNSNAIQEGPKLSLHNAARSTRRPNPVMWKRGQKARSDIEFVYILVTCVTLSDNDDGEITIFLLISLMLISFVSPKYLSQNFPRQNEAA